MFVQCRSHRQREMFEGWVGARQFHSSGLAGSEFRCLPETLGGFDVSVTASRHNMDVACIQSHETVVPIGDALLGCEAMYFGRMRRRFGGMNCNHIKDRRVSKARNRQEQGDKRSSACLTL